MYDEPRYEYRSMEIPCPLCECMISIFRMAQHQWSKTKDQHAGLGSRVQIRIKEDEDHAEI
jgi:hypothetical protein